MDLKSNKNWGIILGFFKKILIFSLALGAGGCLLLPILYVYRTPIISAYNLAMPALLDGGGQQCINNLNIKQVKFSKLGDIGTEDCPRLNAVKITGFQNTKVSSLFILSCPTANKVAS